MKLLFVLVILFTQIIFAEEIYELNTPKRQTLLSPFTTNKDGSVNVAFFDADSTLRVTKSGSLSPNSPNDYIILPNVTNTLARLYKQGYLIVIVSNQGGIPKFVSLKKAELSFKYLIRDLANNGAKVHYFDFGENYDENRKPEIGMATRLEQALKRRGAFVNKENSFMVGDAAYKKSLKDQPAEIRPDGREGFNFSNSDRLFAENYGIRFMEPQHFFKWADHGIDVIDNMNVYYRYQNAKKLIKCRVVFN